MEGRGKILGWGMVLTLVFTLLASQSIVFGFSEPIRIGTIFPRSGFLADLGIESWRGAEVARLERNEKGGIKGQKIVYVDTDAPNVDAAVSNAESLINREKVKVICGTYWSSGGYAASAVAEKYKTLYFEFTSVSDELTERGFKYLLRTAMLTSGMGGAIVNFIAESAKSGKIGVKPQDLKVAVIHEDSLMGTSISQFIMNDCKKKGLNVVHYEAYSAKATDLSPLVLKLKDKQTDILISACYLTDAILLSRQMKELGLKVKAQFGSSGGHGLLDFVNAVKEDAVGVYVTVFPYYGMNRKFTPGIENFETRYFKMFKEKPHAGHSVVCYMGAKVLFDSIEKAGKMDPLAIRQAAMTIDIPLGGTEAGWGVKFDPNTGQNTRSPAVLFMWQKDMTLGAVYPPGAAITEGVFRK